MLPCLTAVAELEFRFHGPPSKTWWVSASAPSLRWAPFCSAPRGTARVARHPGGRPARRAGRAAVAPTSGAASHNGLGDVCYARLRGVTYAVGFRTVMLALGLIVSPWAVLALPATILVGFAFGACGTAAATYFRSWQDMEWMTLAVLPMFLFSTTFFPLSTYDGWLQVVVRCTPLYQSVTLLRDLTLGTVTWSSLEPVAYLVAMGAFGLWLTGRRISSLLLR